MIKSGIILEINKDNVIVLSKDGDFLCLKRNDVVPTLGNEYEGIIYKKPVYLKSIALAASILLLLNFMTIYLIYFQTYNTVDIASNSAIRLYTNRKNNIIKAEGTNDSGKELLSKTKCIKGESCENAIIDIIESAIKLKYVNPGYSTVQVNSNKKNAINLSLLSGVLKKVNDKPSSDTLTTDNKPSNNNSSITDDDEHDNDTDSTNEQGEGDDDENDDDENEEEDKDKDKDEEKEEEDKDESGNKDEDSDNDLDSDDND